MEFRGRVDSVETRRDGHMIVVDIKTSDQGLSGNKLESGELPQLWLYHMGLVQAQHGQGFIPHLGNVALSYWIMPNGQDAGEMKASEIFTAEQVTQVLERFTKHATHYACSHSAVALCPRTASRTC